METGYPKFQWNSWGGLLAPVATPSEKIQDMSRAVDSVLNDPAMKVRFTQLGGKIKLVQTSKTLDPEAQVILSLDPTDPTKKKLFLNLKVENKFSQDLIYKAQLRSLTENRKIMAPVYPVVAGKMSLETFPPHVEEIAIFGYELER